MAGTRGSWECREVLGEDKGKKKFKEDQFNFEWKLGLLKSKSATQLVISGDGIIRDKRPLLKLDNCLEGREDTDHGFLRKSTPEDQGMEETELEQPLTSGNNLISLLVVAPYPNANKAEILTSTLYKIELENTLAEKNTKIRTDQVKSKTKKKVILSKSSSKSKNIFKSKKSTKTKFESDDSCKSDVDVECLFCGNNYGSDRHGEGWIMCGECGKWAQDACAGVESDDDDGAFLCEIRLE
ncbi:hypothetical protein FQA39_LY01017 [Lamprigera yunnana]|nr:hypothetical protein FQA39_LY01017 [Lamprigera yunnana]